MAKKKRKTRREKEALTVHKFSHAKTEIMTETTADAGSSETKPVAKSKIAPYVMKDFKKVLMVTGLIIVFVTVIYFLAHYTNLLNFFFDKVNVKY